MQKKTSMKTTLAKVDYDARGWVIINLDGKVLGRAATKIANLLRGKEKVTFTPHTDMGDFVVVINASKVVLTGDKMKKKIYYKHTGYIGGLKETSAEKLLARNPESMIEKAVWGMMPKTTLSRQMMRKLKVYTDANHPHEAQQPKAVEI